MNHEGKIRFETKEESNQRRMNEALQRTPHERFLFFLQMMDEIQFFKKGEHPNRVKNNFIIE
ncbi:MAG: hypothetical protein JXR61_05125 [Prolixibacteraceae bacterium]|nr:hypothetical protein [Prolixibacteraceae bacterium]